MYALGYDIGSSSIKAAIVDNDALSTIGTAQYPNSEMDILAVKSGWAEQDPDSWWDNLILVTQKLLAQTGIDGTQIKSIGISYQMHGLVLVNKDFEVLRPSIIWCDSRAVEIGNQAFKDLGSAFCLNHLLNSPGNFTTSKLKWVKDNEPWIFDQIHKIMLPGDFIGMKLTGQINTTIAGLSEAVLWDFKNNAPSKELLSYFGFDHSILPDLVDTIGIQGNLSKWAAQKLKLSEGIPVAYRSGDQPNNALALNVLKPGELAATGGTSGVVFGVTDQLISDNKSRVNGFAHVNHAASKPSLGILLCINGAGIQYGWMKGLLDSGKTSYTDIERIAASAPINADGLKIMPFGNGAERILENRAIGGSILNINFNRHKKAHLYRAALEGIAYSFVYGCHILKEMGVKIQMMKVGNDNLFQSKVFSTTIASVLDCEIEMLSTTGAVGAAKASAVGAGLFYSLEELMQDQKIVSRYTAADNANEYKSGYDEWHSELIKLLN
uniref:xylulokinase n=1 Tax=Roseivirga sp. TaxID=1964215 RepID=UPI004047270A